MPQGSARASAQSVHPQTAKVTKQAVHSAMVRHPTWSVLSDRARSLVTTLLGEAGGVDRLEVAEGMDLWGRAIFRVRRKISTIAAQIGRSVGSVHRALAELRDAEWVWVIRTGRASIIELVLPAPRVAEHAAGGARGPAPIPGTREIRSRARERSDLSDVRDPLSRTPAPGRLRQQAPPPRDPSGGEGEQDPARGAGAGSGAPPAPICADPRRSAPPDRVAADWSRVAIAVGWAPGVAERLGGVVAQHRLAGHQAGLTPEGLRNILEHVRERVQARGTGSAYGAVRSPEALTAHLIRSGGCEPSRASQRRRRQASAAYAAVAAPAVGPGSLIDRTA